MRMILGSLLGLPWEAQAWREPWTQECGWGHLGGHPEGSELCGESCTPPAWEDSTPVTRGAPCAWLSRRQCHSASPSVRDSAGAPSPGRTRTGGAMQLLPLPPSLRLPWLGSGQPPWSLPGHVPETEPLVGLSRNRMALLREATVPAVLGPQGEVPFLGASGHPARARWLPTPRQCPQGLSGHISPLATLVHATVCSNIQVSPGPSSLPAPPTSWTHPEPQPRALICRPPGKPQHKQALRWLSPPVPTSWGQRPLAWVMLSQGEGRRAGEGGKPRSPPSLPTSAS